MAEPDSDLPPGAQRLNGKVYLTDAKGNLVPEELVKPQDRLRDNMIRELMAKAQELHDHMVDFREAAFARVQEFLDLVDQEYGAKARPGGAKGNVTLATFDGLMRLQVQVADLIKFESSALQSCKSLVDEYLADASADSDADLRVMLINAFRTNRAGEINRGALLGLLRLEFKDPRMIQAMRALKDSIQVDQTKSYMRFHQRERLDESWRNLSLDLATA